MKSKPALILLGLIITLVGCRWPLMPPTGSSGPNLVPGEVVTIRGDVVGSIDDCVRDGICAAVLETDSGRVNAIWAQGMLPCEGQMDTNLPTGSTIEVYGEVTEPDAVTICTDPSYYLRQVNGA